MNTYRLRVGSHDPEGNFAENVCHFNLSEAGVGVTPYEYAQALVLKFGTNILPSLLLALANDTVIDFIAAKRITGGGGPEFVFTSTSNGSEGTNVISGIVAANLYFRTASPTNRAGHWYFFGIPSDAVVSGIIQAAWKTLATTFQTALTTALTLVGAFVTAQFVVWSKKLATGYPSIDQGIADYLSGFNQRKKPLV